MYALVGEFSVSWNIRTVPLTKVSHKAFFSRSQNARKLGNRGRSHILQASVEIRSHRNFYTLLLLDIWFFLQILDIYFFHFLDTLSSEPLLPARSSPTCNNPQHSDFTESWWWKLGKDLVVVALKRFLLGKCNYYKAKKWLLQPKFFK